ncbi:hypothetical protein VTP01DRAFT_1156 [Rhizomucor pusillus]|uniref:uncharacterized protein n=1 Tax=Rhizomucor pusillus TaxID=4840 RepID=UPI0037443942
MIECIRKYRSRSVNLTGAKKSLSDSRILSLSFIFLLSPHDRCVLTKLAPHEKVSVMQNTLCAERFPFVHDDVLLACLQKSAKETCSKPGKR